MSCLQRALEIAVQAHAGQTDKAGYPYIGHPMAVMRFQKSEAARICGVLHDVVEDTCWTFDDLREEGFAEEILAALDCLTHRDGEGYFDYLDRVLTNELACRVKLADLDDNLDPRRALPYDEKYQAARRIVVERLRSFGPGRVVD